MKKTAQEALRTIATWIMDGQTFAWAIVDKIERRWKLQGYVEALCRQQQKAHAEFLAAESRLHDLQNPDRLTYLHR